MHVFQLTTTPCRIVLIFQQFQNSNFLFGGGLKFIFEVMGLKLDPKK